MSLTKQEFNELVAKAGAGTLTDEETAALEPYRTRNAVILVAGTCRRFEPISFDYPKALVEVRGEVLIERQIRQLMSVGITDITLIVGFMAEKFYYLGEKYGVKFVGAPECVITNNLWSLYEARDVLGGTYILYGDQYFTVNPFEPYVYRSFYATTLTTSDDAWVVETDPEGVVTDMIMRPDGGEKLQGPCYVDIETGAGLAAALDEAHATRANKDYSWEFAWYLHRDKLNIVTRFYPEGVINSFKTMDELKAFDDSYLLHVKSPSMDNICNYLGCTYEDMYDFVPLLGGLTNFSVVFSVGDTRYVYRHPIGYGAPDFDRAAEAAANALARDCGVDPTFIYEDPETGWKLSYFLKGCRPVNPFDRTQAIPGSKLIAKFHEATKGVEVEQQFDVFQLACDYEKQITSRGHEIDEKTLSFRDDYYKLASYVEADGYEKALCHNDAWYANMLFDENDDLVLIDWEFAAMGDWMGDIGNHTSSYYTFIPVSDYDFMREQLVAYFDGRYTFEQYRHLFALVMLRSWKTAMWILDLKFNSDMACDWPLDVWIEQTWGGLEYSTPRILALYEDEDAIAAEKAYMEEYFERIGI